MSRGDHRSISCASTTPLATGACAASCGCCASSSSEWNVSTLPDSFQSKQGFELLERDFTGGQVFPVEIVLDGDVGSPNLRPEILAASQRLSAILANDSVFGGSTVEVNRAGALALISVQMALDPYADELRAATVRLAGLDHALKGGSRLAPELELERALIEITTEREPAASHA